MVPPPPFSKKSVISGKDVIPHAKFRLGTVSVSELNRYHSGNERGRVFVSILGEIYDVSRKPEMYGKSGAYSMFGGHDVTLNLALGSFDTQYMDQHVRDLPARVRESVEEWRGYYQSRYARVGRLKGFDFQTSDPNVPTFDSIVPDYKHRISKRANQRTSKL